MVGDHSAPRPAASATFQLATTRAAASGAALSAARARMRSAVFSLWLGLVFRSHAANIGRPE
jgi:hypothetical protein